MGDTKTVALFITCLVDLFRPSVGFSSVQLLRDAGFQVEIPKRQTCCGQVPYNTGAYEQARPLARQHIALFENYDYVVVPSGSCAGMIKHHYPKLLQDDEQWLSRAQALADNTWELTSFLLEVANYQPTTSLKKIITYHDGCAGLREMAVKSQPRQLLQSCTGIELIEMQHTEVCCGFGGTFCAKMPQISGKMVTDKLADAEATGAELLLGGEMGCLMNISGRARRLGKTLEVRHIAEVLAGQLDQPAIGEGTDNT